MHVEEGGPIIDRNGWTRTPSFQLPSGKVLTPGTEVGIRGERGGRFRFIDHCRRPDGVEWLNFVGGTHNVVMYRSFRPDRVTRVYKRRSR